MFSDDFGKSCARLQIKRSDNQRGGDVLAMARNSSLRPRMGHHAPHSARKAVGAGGLGVVLNHGWEELTRGGDDGFVNFLTSNSCITYADKKRGGIAASSLWDSIMERVLTSERLRRAARA